MGYITQFQITVYRKIASPLTERNEFYEVWIEPLGQTQKWVIQERHGWWDDAAGAPRFLVATRSPIDPAHAYDLKRAHAEARNQVGVRAGQGFKFAPIQTINAAGDGCGEEWRSVDKKGEPHKV